MAEGVPAEGVPGDGSGGSRKWKRKGVAGDGSGARKKCERVKGRGFRWPLVAGESEGKRKLRQESAKVGGS